eukprot:gene2948-2224_t
MLPAAGRCRSRTGADGAWAVQPDEVCDLRRQLLRRTTGNQPLCVNTDVVNGAAMRCRKEMCQIGDVCCDFGSMLTLRLMEGRGIGNALGHCTTATVSPAIMAALAQAADCAEGHGEAELMTEGAAGARRTDAFAPRWVSVARDGGVRLGRRSSCSGVRQCWCGELAVYGCSGEAELALARAVTGGESVLTTANMDGDNGLRRRRRCEAASPAPVKGPPLWGAGARQTGAFTPSGAAVLVLAGHGCAGGAECELAEYGYSGETKLVLTAFGR